MAAYTHTHTHAHTYIKFGRRDEVDRAGSRYEEEVGGDGGGSRLLNMTDRSLGKLSKCTVRGWPSAPPPPQRELDAGSAILVIVSKRHRFTSGYWPISPRCPVIAGNQSRGNRAVGRKVD